MEGERARRKRGREGKSEKEEIKKRHGK